MPISFAKFPDNWRQPLYWVEVDSSMAGLATYRAQALLIGQKLAAGVAVDNVPLPISSQAQADYQYGAGSMLSQMFARFFQNNRAQELWCIPIAAPTGASAAGQIRVTAGATAAGTYCLYIAGQKVEVAVQAGDTPATICTAIAAAITAKTSVPVSAAISSGSNEVTVTCKWVGETGNDIFIRDSYRGARGGETLPVGMTVVYLSSTHAASAAGALLSGGSGVPVWDDTIAAVSDDGYDYVAMPFTDSGSITAWDAEYGFTDGGRWGWMREQFGMVFSAYRGDYATALAWGPGNNSPVISVMAVDAVSPSPVWEWAAAYAAKAARALSDDPARPLQTLNLEGVLVAPRHLRYAISELNNLSGVGLATQSVSTDGITPTIKRESTTYQLNDYGQPDDAYELVTTLATLQLVLRNQKAAITTKWPRHKLADDGTRFGVGQAIVTPRVIKAELVVQYQIDEFNGLVENHVAFKNALVVERDNTNPNRVNVLYPPDLINQLRIFAVLAQFRLQMDRGVNPALA